MTTYTDTGFLCSLYAPDAHSSGAVAHMRRQALPLPFTWLHQLELRNALRLRVSRREITRAQRDASLNAVLADLAAGVLAVATIDHAALLIEAERLSALHSERLGARSLDIRHVAAALVLGDAEILTSDRRQRALALAAGLRAPALCGRWKRPASARRPAPHHGDGTSHADVRRRGPLARAQAEDIVSHSIAVARNR